MALILFIDNYDSFTYNLVQYFETLAQRVCVRQHDKITLVDISLLAPDYIVIGPGPCTPAEAGISLDVIKHFAGTIPILGVCLGHQAISQAFGGHIVSAHQIMHGRVSNIYHKQLGIFNNLPSPFKVTRYHSLMIDPKTLPPCLQITAWSQDEIGNLEAIMGIRHRTLPIEGVQFHPESILSEYGHTLLNNFLLNYQRPKV